MGKISKIILIINSILIYNFDCILFGQLNNSQKEKEEEEILLKIKQSSNDSLNMEFYNQLRKLVVFDDPKRALNYNEIYSDLAQKLNLKVKIGLGKFYKANILIPMNKNQEALESLLKAEEIFIELEDDQKLVGVLNSLGAVYENFKLDKEALKYFEKCLDLGLKLADKRRQLMALNNISNIYFREGSYSKSRGVLDKAYQLKEAIDDRFKAILDLNYANTLRELNKIYESEKIYHKILESKTQDNLMLAQAYFGLGKIEYSKKDTEAALEKFKKSKSIANENELNQLALEVDEWIVKVYETKTDFENAFNALKDSKSASDSVHNIVLDQKLIEAIKKYETEKKDKEIKVLTLENKISSLNLKKSKQLSWFFLFVTLLLSLLAWLFWRLKSQREKSNLTLKQTNDQLKIALNDKNILLREIHHRVKNNLQVISSLLKLQSQYIEDEGAVKAIAEGRNRVHSMALLHQNLYKEDNLTGVNMKEYFTNLIEGLFDAYNINDDDIKLQTEIEDLTLDIDTVIPLGLITNELVSNALKHAFGDKSNALLIVKLWEKDDRLMLQVKDNGKGYNPGIVAEGRKSFGQKLIKSLSDKLEANVLVDTNSGAEITLSIKDYKKAS